MTDGEKAKYREDFNILREATLKVKKNSPEWNQFIGMITVLGKVLDEPSVRESYDKVMAGLRDFLRTRHGYDPEKVGG